MFFIYRNIVGTFLTIGSWQKDNGKSEINTMVRLGNGHSSQLKTNYSPFNINPFVLSLKIGQEENIVEFDEGGNLRVDG